MDLEPTTESFCDQWKKRAAERMEENGIQDEEMMECPGISSIILIGLVRLISFPCYLWRFWKSRRAGPATQIPRIPINKKNVLEFGGNRINRARIYSDSKLHPDNSCTGKLKEIMKVVFNLKSPALLPQVTRVISIRMEGFKEGAEFHSFEPENGMIPGSHFTYQMFGDDTIQVTRYVVGNKSYVAGICVFIKNDSVRDVDISMNVIRKLMKDAKYPGKEVVEKELKEDLKTGKDSVPLKFALFFNGHLKKQ